MRRGDIESLKVSDLDFAKNCVTTMSKKTGKGMGSRPVAAEVTAELKKFLSAANSGQARLFNDNFS